MLCAGANYYDHIAEMGVPDLRKEAQRLFFFFKPPRNALVGPGRTVRYPADSKMFDWEVELAAVIGKRSRRLTLGNALDAVAAYTIGIDLSARDLNRRPIPLQTRLGGRQGAGHLLPDGPRRCRRSSPTRRTSRSS